MKEEIIFKEISVMKNLVTKRMETSVKSSMF